MVWITTALTECAQDDRIYAQKCNHVLWSHKKSKLRITGPVWSTIAQPPFLPHLHNSETSFCYSSLGWQKKPRYIAIYRRLPVYLIVRSVTLYSLMWSARLFHVSYKNHRSRQIGLHYCLRVHCVLIVSNAGPHYSDGSWLYSDDHTSRINSHLSFNWSRYYQRIAFSNTNI